MTIKKAKRWVISIISIIFVSMSLIVSFNIFIDPLWMFPHTNTYNDVQQGFNQRLQKINRITFQPFDYDSLLLGNSRVSYMNQYDFVGERVYNFSVSSMRITEFNEFIEFAKQKKGTPFRNIYIGYDFQYTNKAYALFNSEIQPYIEATQDSLYPLKMLSSYDTTTHSVDNFKASTSGTLNYYQYFDRANVRVSKQTVDPRLSKSYTATLNMYRNSYTDENYKFNTSQRFYIQEWLANNTDTKIVIFTPPISSPMLHLILEQGRLDDYKLWLRLLVSQFGEIYHFQYENSISKDLSNFYDLNHFTDQVGTLIIHKITGVPDPNIPDDFGMILTEENLKTYFQELDKLYKQSEVK